MGRQEPEENAMDDQIEVHQPVKGPRIKKGLVIVNTGDGKGKTTAALGILFRSWGRGMRVRMFQFLKQTTANFGEHRAAKNLGIPIQAMGDGFTWRNPMLHVIITGRDAPQELIDYADLVTEMRVVKHPYRDQGIKAQPGIEF